MDTRISGGTVIDPASGRQEVMDVLVTRDTIVGMGRAPRGFANDRVFDARGCLVVPGLVDLATRVREPGQEHKGTIKSEAGAAARGGFTTICVPPDTDPVIDTPAVVELINHRTRGARAARLVCLGALTRALAGEVLAEMAALKEIGCVGVSNGTVPIQDTEVLRHALEYAATFDLTVFVEPRDAWLGRHGHMHESPASVRLGIPGIPAASESIAVARTLLLAEECGTRVHFGRITAARSVRMVQDARRRGAAVSMDTGMAYLHLADSDIEAFDGRFHVLPPLRGSADRTALRKGLAAGSIAAVCSDHQPHDGDAKAAPFSATAPGMSMLDSFVPLLFDLVDQGKLTLERAIDAAAVQPARILGIDSGELAVGRPADITVLDPKARWTLDERSMHSAGRNTPFAGRDMTGRAMLTLVGGRVVHDLLSSR